MQAKKTAIDWTTSVIFIFPYIFSAGVGRTGTFIVMDILMQEIRSKCTHVDIFGTILNMRNYRLNMVQTEVNLLIFLNWHIHSLIYISVLPVFVSKIKNNKDTKRKSCYPLILLKKIHPIKYLLQRAGLSNIFVFKNDLIHYI